MTRCAPGHGRNYCPPISGGHIRNAALRAAFLAAGQGRPIDQATLVADAEREVEEMGRIMATPLGKVS
jgi:hypothetical protein